MLEDSRIDEIVGIELPCVPHCPLEDAGPCRMHKLFDWLKSWVKDNPGCSIDLTCEIGAEDSPVWKYSVFNVSHSRRMTGTAPDLKNAVTGIIAFIESNPA